MTAAPDDLLHPLPGAMRVTRDGVCRDKPMTVTAYLNHINMCFAAVLEMHRAEGCGRKPETGNQKSERRPA